jgi:hypothetical protein
MSVGVRCSYLYRLHLGVVLTCFGETCLPGVLSPPYGIHSLAVIVTAFLSLTITVAVDDHSLAVYNSFAHTRRDDKYMILTFVHIFTLSSPRRIGNLEHCASTTERLEIRDADWQVDPWVRTYGTLDAGLETMRSAWPMLEHRFAIHRQEDVCIDVEEETYRRVGPRCPSNLLTCRPVDLLIVERGHIRQPPNSFTTYEWESLVAVTPKDKRPRVIIESWSTGSHLWEQGPTTKGAQTRWEKLGYTSRFKRVDSSHVGGAIAQVRLLVARVRDDYAHLWSWRTYPNPPYQPRPMGNLLTPPGLVKPTLYCSLPFDSPQPTTDPMPCFPGVWIRTERGHR